MSYTRNTDRIRLMVASRFAVEPGRIAPFSR